jgi:hypothetical protein
VAQDGITVFFSSTTGGVLAHGASGVSTHSDGRAIDVLTLAPGAPASITVTATSAALTKTVTVGTTGAGVCGLNTAPTVKIDPNPTTAPEKTGSNTTVSVTLNSTGTIDLQTDTEDLTYSWNCGAGGSPTGATTDDHVVCTYTYKATDEIYSVTLTVTDDGLNGETCEDLSGEETASVTVPGTGTGTGTQ